MLTLTIFIDINSFQCFELFSIFLQSKPTQAAIFEEFSTSKPTQTAICNSSSIWIELNWIELDIVIVIVWQRAREAAAFTKE